MLRSFPSVTPPSLPHLLAVSLGWGWGGVLSQWKWIPCNMDLIFLQWWGSNKDVNPLHLQHTIYDRISSHGCSSLQFNLHSTSYLQNGVSKFIICLLCLTINDERHYWKTKRCFLQILLLLMIWYVLWYNPCLSDSLWNCNSILT